MTKKNVKVAYTIAVFAYLYAGNVVRAPYYDAGNAVLAYLCTSMAVLIGGGFIFRYFAGHTFISSHNGARFFAIFVTCLAALSAGAFAEKFISSLGEFAPYYGELFPAISASAVLLFICIYGAERGRICVAGFGTLVFWVFAVWTMVGFFAFFTTKQAFLPESPFASVRNVKWWNLLGEVLYVCMDMTFLAAVLTDNESKRTRSVTPSAFMRGSVLFVLFSGLNLFKNLMLFGEDFASAAQNPDLAAIRLVPLLDLPEISVVVDTFACALKIGVYFCAVFYALKNAYGDFYRTRPAKNAVFLLSASGLAVTMTLRRMGAFSDKLSFVFLGVVIAAAFLFFVLYAEHTDTQKNSA